MSSLRQIEASRSNGARSRGPVSPSGKQASARNSLRHGLLARTVVLEGESLDGFKTMLKSLTREFNPATEAETELVETMAVSRWRLLRIWGIQKTEFDREIDLQPREAGPKCVRAGMAFRNMADNSRSLDLLLRYETSLERQYNRALKNLLNLQATRPPTEPYEPEGDPAMTWEPNQDESDPVIHVDSCALVVTPINQNCETNLIPFPDTPEPG